MNRTAVISVVLVMFVAALAAAGAAGGNPEPGRFTPPDQSDLPSWNTGDFWVYDCTFTTTFAGWSNKEWTGHVNYSVQSTSTNKNGFDCYQLNFASQDTSPGDPILNGVSFVKKADLSLVAMNWTEAGIDGSLPYTHFHEIYFQTPTFYDYYRFPIMTMGDNWYVNTTMYEEISNPPGINHFEVYRKDTVKIYNKMLGWTEDVPNIQGNYSGQRIEGSEQTSGNDYDSRYYSPDFKNFLYREFRYTFNDTGMWQGVQKLVKSNYKPPAANKAPSVTGPQAVPDEVEADDADTTVLRAVVTDDGGLAAENPVTVDLSAIGYDAETPMLEDPVVQDGYYVATTVKETTISGEHKLYITATDNQDLVNDTVYITLTVVSPNNPPRVSNAKAEPASIPNDGATPSLLQANVSDVDGNLNNVTVDLSKLGGSSIQPMYDDGSNGDAAASDGIFSFAATAATGTAPDTYELRITADDETQLVNDTQVISLTVTEWHNTAPKVESSKAEPNTIPNNGAEKTLLSAKVTDADGDALTVTIDLTSIGGAKEQAMLDDGFNGDKVAGDSVFSVRTTVAKSTEPEQYSLPITATDSFETVFSNIKITVVDANSSNNPPTINWVQSEPNKVVNDGEGFAIFTADVFEGDEGQNLTVTIDLTPIGGPSAEPLMDDGSGADEFADDNVYTAIYTIPVGTKAKSYSLTVTATDNGAPPKSDTSTVSLEVESDDETNYPPEIAFVVVNPVKVIGTDRNITISAFVTDSEEDPFEVYVDLTSVGMGGRQLLYDDGTNGDDIAGNDQYGFRLELPADLPNGNYRITVWVEQSGQQVGVMESISFEVDVPAPPDPDDDDDDDEDDTGSPGSWKEDLPVIIILFVFLFLIVLFLVLILRKPKRGADADGGGLGDDDDESQAMVRM